MIPNDCCELVREAYSQIASGDVGFAAKPIACAVKALNEIAANESYPLMNRRQAAQAAATLLLSDHED